MANGGYAEAVEKRLDVFVLKKSANATSGLFFARDDFGRFARELEGQKVRFPEISLGSNNTIKSEREPRRHLKQHLRFISAATDDGISNSKPAEKIYHLPEDKIATFYGPSATIPVLDARRRIGGRFTYLKRGGRSLHKFGSVISQIPPIYISSTYYSGPRIITKINWISGTKEALIKH